MNHADPAVNARPAVQASYIGMRNRNILAIRVKITGRL
jgi:hypothetical protein